MVARCDSLTLGLVIQSALCQVRSAYSLTVSFTSDFWRILGPPRPALLEIMGPDGRLDEVGTQLPRLEAAVGALKVFQFYLG